MSIEIRKASINNLKDIQRLNHKLFELEYSNFDSSLKVGWSYEKEGTKYFTNMITNKIVFICIDENNNIVGYLAGNTDIKTSYNTKSMAEIDNMIVEEKYRKEGLGTRLINKFKEYCLELGIQELKVTASSKNSNAINFYKKNGFENFETTLKIKLDK